MIELLSPVGDFECLKSAVQNGADSVYFGASSFSARAFASNFDDESLEKAINYAKIRGVKTNLTLNTLIKNEEMQNAINLATKAYEYGIDAIIVQDLGLARYLIRNFPDLAIHASTQMSVHNLDGVLALQKLGFSRVVLSRELSLQEIEYICKNSNIEIEVFVHGALCVSYSGQCLFSSIVGGRSGNRGKCAQPCRLPYELLENDNTIDKGYLLSPRDLCSLDYIPQFVKAGVSCLKIEGRMKTPEYVGIVTRIYRKYLDLAINENFPKTIDPQDKKDLLQVFNRGGFSCGHLSSSPNKDLVYKNKSNNMGIFLGTIKNFNPNKGYISFVSNDFINIGDKVCIENKKKETSIYTVSELMENNKNILQGSQGQYLKIGRMKGKISVGDLIYKLSDKSLSSSVSSNINTELRKVDLSCKLLVKRDMPIYIEVCDNYGNVVNIVSDIFPVSAINAPITVERLATQISKTNNTPFQFKSIDIDLDDGLYIQGISNINELRRQVLAKYENCLISSFKRCCKHSEELCFKHHNIFHENKYVSVLLNVLNINFDYAKLKNVDRLYIPFKYFVFKDYSGIINLLTNNFDTYIYMPTIIRNNYKNLIDKNLSNILNSYKIKGFVVSNIGNFELLSNYCNDYEFVCNYTFNVFNNLSVCELPCDVITLSPELNKYDLQKMDYFNNTELIVYGNTVLMNSNYCLLGNSNKCYTDCKHLCNSLNTKYYLKDRLGFLFRIIPDNVDTITSIFNSKITSIEHINLDVSSVRIDILDENIDEINHIIDIVKTGNKLEGPNFTNGNFNREI